MAPGTYKYDFEYVLPTTLPSSKPSAHGSIAYFAALVVDTPEWPEKQIHSTFTLIRHIDLNDFPPLRVIEDLDPLRFSLSALFEFHFILSGTSN